jgi:hypothetical protein
MEQEQKQEQRSRSKKIMIQQRDVVILKFLDRVGYASLGQIVNAIGLNINEKTNAAILRRLYILNRFEYIKIFSTHQGNYYSLEKKGRGSNQLINSIKLDQLEHHDYLTKLFLFVQQYDSKMIMLSERETIAKFKTIGRKGKVPDMIINDWVIEYERTNKSTNDCREVINYWIYDQAKKLCIVYETEEIKNRYSSLVNTDKIQLVSSKDLNLLLQIVTNKAPKQQHITNNQKDTQNNKDNQEIQELQQQPKENILEPEPEKPKPTTKYHNYNKFEFFDLDAYLSK